ncbi:DUF6049 family protein [Microbacterium album]|uniref:2-oxoglutarate dehydrogenase n=1 Tax=Microbacterium album TaxID=2053191 RepID=A0A917MLS6_9MICO|nr:DUF6049 family protein [Microbacterium album]GGH44213.1 hypothetical protein GCM10010921_18710 [Microbacterium album]
MTERPRGTTARSRWRRLAALTAVALTGALGAVAPPAQAATEDDDGSVELSLVAGTRGVTTPGAPFTAVLDIDNPSGEALPPGTAILHLGEQPLRDRDALRAWLRGEGLDVPLTAVGAARTDEVAPGETSSVSVRVDSSEDAIADLGPGVYPVRAQLAGTAVQSVVVVADSPRPVGIVLPITAPATTAGVLTSAQLAALTAPDGLLTAQLDAAAGSEAILAVDPAIPAAIRALGETAPASAQTWLSRLTMLANERFALQFADADVAAQVHAGLDGPLRPTSLGAYEAPAPQSSPTPSPSPAGVPDDTPPDLDALLDIGRATGSVYWPMRDAMGPEVLDGLRAWDRDAVALVASRALREGADRASVGARGEGLLAYDAGISAALESIARQQDETARAAAEVAAAAELWFAGDETGGRPLLLALDRMAGVLDDGEVPEAAVDADGLAAALDIVTASAAVEPLGLRDLLEAPPARLTPTTAEPDEPRVAFVAEALAGEARLSHTATVLEDPELLTGQARAEALQVLSVAWDGRTALWRDAARAHLERVRARAEGVGIQQPTTVQLVSAGAALPVWIHNDLPYPVTATLIAQPDDPRLDVTEFTTVTAQPLSSTSIQVPVEARVGSGQVRVALTLLSPTGEQIGPTQTMEVTVRADWERVGIGILIALVTGLVITGVVRTVRRSRRARRARLAEAGSPHTPEGRHE